MNQIQGALMIDGEREQDVRAANGMIDVLQ